GTNALDAMIVAVRDVDNSVLVDDTAVWTVQAIFSLALAAARDGRHGPFSRLDFSDRVVLRVDDVQVVLTVSANALGIAKGRLRARPILRSQLARAGDGADDA